MKTLYTKKDIAIWWAERGNETKTRDDIEIFSLLSDEILLDRTPPKNNEWFLRLEKRGWKNCLVLRFYEKECIGIIGYYGNPYDNARMEMIR